MSFRPALTWRNLDLLLRRKRRWRRAEGDATPSKNVPPNLSSSEFTFEGLVLQGTRKGGVHIPDHTVINLLIAAIHSNFSLSKNPNKILGCPRLKVKDVNKVLDNIKPFDTHEKLAAVLMSQLGDENKVLTRICDSFGDLLKPATGDLTLPEFPESVRQFFLTKLLPNAEQQSGQWIVLFHGTRLHFLHSILQVGLKRSEDGFIWMAEEPRVSYDYASGLAGGRRIPEPTPGWKNSPYENFGVLLVCQVKDGEHPRVPLGNGFEHFVLKEEEVLVRYVLLLPIELHLMLPWKNELNVQRSSLRFGRHLKRWQERKQ